MGLVKQGGTMSKDQKTTVEIPVDTVEKIYFMLNWITTTITFWELNDKWPTDLIQDTVDELINVIHPYWDDPFVSRSHINDK